MSSILGKISSGSVISVTQIRNILIILFGLWALFSLSQLVWILLIPSESSSEEQALPAIEIVTPGEQADIDIDALKSYNLFGTASGSVGTNSAPVEPVAPEITDDQLNAAKTKLDLQLIGTAYAGDQQQALAVIMYKKKQEQYRVGDKLPVGNQVKLSKVLTDRVIISNNGRYESLWLYDESKVAARVAQPAPRRVEPRPEESVTKVIPRQAARQDLEGLQEMLLEDPSSLADIVRVAPIRRGGQMLGYRVTPGPNSRLFRQLGFEPNDVVTSVNGVELNTSDGVLAVYQLMQTSPSANFRVERDGEMIELAVSLLDANEI